VSRCTDAPEAGAGVRVAEWAVEAAAAACLVPGPYEDTRDCDAMPILAGDVADGFPTGES